MKARVGSAIERTVRQKTEEFVTAEYNRIKYETFKEVAPEIMQQTVALMLYGMKLHGYGEVRLNKAMEWFEEAMSFPEIMGKKPSAMDCLKYLEKNYSIDFSSITPNIESFEEFMKR